MSLLHFIKILWKRNDTITSCNRIIFFFILSFLSTSFLSAQVSSKGIIAQINLDYGQLVRHSTKIVFDKPDNSFGIELNLKYQTRGTKAWQTHQRFPQLGVAFSYYSLGNKEILGNAWGIVPNLTIPLKRFEPFSFYFRIGTGLGYLTKPFDLLTNPLNNAIGSHFNTSVSLRFLLEYQLTPHWQINTHVGLMHYSNGAASLPNLGINIPYFGVGTSYFRNPFQPTDFIQQKTDILPQRRFGGAIRFALALKEHLIARGPQYPIYIGSLGGFYHWNGTNRTYIGTEYEFNTAVYNFGKHVYAFNSEQEARWRSSRILFYAAHEFLFGSWSIYLQSGIYASKRFYLTGLPVHFKISTRYYLPPIGNPKTRFFVGIQLKSHLSIAEYISLGAGAAF